MKDLVRLMKQEWEICIACILCCLGIAALAWCFLGQTAENDGEMQSRKKWHYGNRISDEDLAFLNISSADAGENMNSPFTGVILKKKKPVPVHRRRTVPGPVPTTVPRTAPVRAEKKTQQKMNTDTNSAVKKQTVIKEKALPPVSLEPCLAQYVFYRQNQAGKAVAIVKTLNRSRASRVYTFYNGQKQGGLTVLGISPEKVKLRDAQNKIIQLSYRKWTRLMMTAENKNS